MKLATDAEDRTKNVRSSSVPLNKKANEATKAEEQSKTNVKKKAAKQDHLDVTEPVKPETVNIKPFQPNKKEKAKDKKQQVHQD